MVSGFDEGYNTTIITKLLIGIMNKRTIQIGSLCIVLLLLISLLYVTKTNEGFADSGADSLVKAKQAVTEATAAGAVATKAVGSATEVSAAKDAFSKATAAVAAANAAVTYTKDAFGNLNIANLDTFASTAKDNLAKAQADANTKAAAVTAAEAAYKSAKEKADDANVAYKNL